MPETREAIDKLAEYGDTEVSTELLRIGREVQEVVPEIIGVSLGLQAENLTFTLVASSALVQQMDAIQYLDDGPCVSAVNSGRPIETTPGNLLDERRWLMFARVLAANGVESTLSLPILQEHRVVAGANLYASTPDAFTGHHQALADICHAWAPGAVANADLSFRSRLEAAATPGRMRDRNTLDQAIGMLAESQQVDTDSAADRILQAAARAGISETQAAQTVIRVLMAR